jgi:hypothetical protein
MKPLAPLLRAKQTKLAAASGFSEIEILALLLS